MSVDAFLSTGIDPLELMKRPKQWFVDQVRKYRGAFGSCLHFRSLGKTLLPPSSTIPAHICTLHRKRPQNGRYDQFIETQDG